MKNLILGVLICFLFLPIKAHASEDTYLSEEIQAACVEIGTDYGICPELLMAMIEKESSGRKNVVSESGHIGLMQITPRFHQERIDRLGVYDLTDIKGNILVGTDYLNELFEKHSDIYMVLMSYNMGERKATELYEQEIYSNYAVSITERSAELETLHGK